MLTLHPQRWIAAVCCTLMLAAPALAGMTLDRSIIHFQPGQAERIDVSVNNRGGEPLYVETKVFEVMAPGTDEEVLRPVVQDPDMALLVSPNRLVIPPGRTKLLRVVNLAGNTDAERVFRVNVKPVPPPAAIEKSGIRLFVGYQLLVFLAPADPAPQLLSRREPGQVIFDNAGNVNILLHSGLQCPPDADPEVAAEACTRFPGNRLYPGESWALETPLESPVEFTVSTGERNSRTRF